jgi:hypothetical protein
VFLPLLPYWFLVGSHFPLINIQERLVWPVSLFHLAEISDKKKSHQASQDFLLYSTFISIKIISQ